MVGKQLTDAEFKKFSDLIYQHVGIFMKLEKKELLNARLGKRLRACQLDSFQEYFDLITQPGEQAREFVEFLDSVSTNFTSFFREVSHFEYMKTRVLPDLVAKRGGNREFVFWSSASSSGEEPYTMAMFLSEFAVQMPGFRYRIIATDISTKVLAMAANGVYPVEQTTKVPLDIMKKYFQKGLGASAGKVKVKEQIRKQVAFQRFNLMGEFPWREEMDVIFCRNVMIYFDRQTQEKLVGKFYDCLARGGYLFIGHSESISSLKHDFVQVEATTYRKV
ncbi:MAG: protein-glutamate O-methyltransferase CheR [Proteobacteria bacterium]|nr:protein-glutamate O-methyltransferase CheR [Desulfobulbaceae bacterium]MBU4153184.1 protein-glutamate O-methyltransferase CheR [Pseudomonadota bacterium]MDP2106441.1 protein-glutamate O-methyltransferase CheR [Desulfobulbaceae bacterium]